MEESLEKLAVLQHTYCRHHLQLIIQHEDVTQGILGMKNINKSTNMGQLQKIFHDRSKLQATKPKNQYIVRIQ